MNCFDSQIMEEKLVDAGYDIVESEERSDLVVVNTCIVKKPTENKILRYLNSLEKQFVVAGCFSAAYSEELISLFPEASMIGTNSEDIVSVVKETEKGGCLRNIKIGGDKICGVSGIIKITAISEGCLGNCSYCSAKLARGNLKSYDINKLVENIRESIESGAKEIWLTSQDTGIYGKDIKTDLVELITRIIDLRGEFLVRIGMMNPDQASELMPDLAGVIKNKKIFNFLHIPVQSGSDNVLKAMNRKYTVKEFKQLVSDLKRFVPDITISTDIICGFPTESENDFKKSIKLIKWLKPDVLNISRYWQRAGTDAAKFKQLHGRVTKDRSRKMTKLFHEISLSNNQKWMGWKGEILVDENGMGRNYAYKPVVLKSDIGKFVRAEIIDVKRHYLVGKII